MTAQPNSDVPKILPLTIEVSKHRRAAAFYAKLLVTMGATPGARHYFDCGGVICRSSNRTKVA